MNKHRDLGNLGESTFMKLCHEVGIVPTGSRIDKNGWDFNAEFPQEDAKSANEIHLSPYECRVQVKSTDDKKGKQQIKLSNLRRACTGLLPSFILIFEFDGKDDAQRAYLVHLDNSWCSKVLKRIHELNLKKPNRELNKHTITVKYSSEHLIDEIKGRAIWKHIRRFIGNDYGKYIAEKKKHLESAGYEAGAGEFTFSTSGEKNIDAFIDSHLGISQQIPIANIKGYNTRFGIKENSPFTDFETGLVEIKPSKPELKGTISFKKGKFGKTVRLPCDIYLGGMNDIFPREQQRFRISCELIDIISKPATGDSKCTFLFAEDSKSVPFSELYKTIEVGQFFAEEEQKIHVEVSVQDKPKLPFVVSGNSKFLPPKELAAAVNSAHDILTYFEFESDLKVTIPQLLYHTHALVTVSQLLNSEPNQIRLEAEALGESTFDEAALYAAVRSIGVLIGNRYLAFQMVLFGKMSLTTENRYRLKIENIATEFPILTAPEESLDEDYIDETLKNIEAKYSEAIVFLANT